MLETVEFQMQNTLDVKMNKNILPVPFKRVRGYHLGQMFWMSLHEVRIANNVYTGMMDACNIQISIPTSYFMQYHSCFLSGKLLMSEYKSIRVNTLPIILQLKCYIIYSFCLPLKC